MIECKCECGEVLPVQINNLISGNTKSCKACGSKLGGEKQIIDITGQKFGFLTVIKMAKSPEGEPLRVDCGYILWECKCDCGNPNPVLAGASDLKKGHTNTVDVTIKPWPK